MSLNLPIRRLTTAAATKPISSLTTTTTTTLRALSTTPSLASARGTGSAKKNQSAIFRGRGRSGRDIDQDPMFKELRDNHDARQRLTARMSAKRFVKGQSIFDDELAAADAAAKEEGAGEKVLQGGTKLAAGFSSEGASLAPEHTARALDPDPRSRVRWERRMVMRRIAKVGTNPFSREPKTAVIQRTERELLAKSPLMATSTKKLVMLARQIAGKSVGEALVQMRYSKKKMAAEVGRHLEESRDKAVVAKGMGLGEANGGVLPTGQEIQVQTKAGKWLKIEDPTRMYIAQAWVGKGPWRGFGADYRARGRVNRLYKPSASISVVLKEEKTRIREHNDREEKKRQRKPWVHLPDRPVTAQRQHYSW